MIGRIAAAVALIAAAAAAILYRNALATPVIAAYDIAVPGWHGPPLRLVQLTDIHLGAPDMPAARVARIVAQANALHPDLIALTGDYHGGKLLDFAPGNLDDAMRPLAALRSRYGTFAVRGNHDARYWAPIVFPRYAMTYLQNAHADAGPVTVAGVDDRTTGMPDVAAALAGIPPGRPVVLLMHEPDGFTGIPASVTVTLAGHTHGGQVRLPLIGAPLINSELGYRRGRFVVAGSTLIVSSGIGTSALPIRLGVPPEIVVVTLRAP